jgi:hypothetical protein
MRYAFRSCKNGKGIGEITGLSRDNLSSFISYARGASRDRPVNRTVAGRNPQRLRPFLFLAQEQIRISHTARLFRATWRV